MERYGVDGRARYHFLELIGGREIDYEHAKDMIDLIWSDAETSARVQRKVERLCGLQPTG